MNAWTSPTVAVRFWAKVDKRGPDECWPWTASLRTTGYGQMSGAQIPLKAHRVSWELANGPIPDGLDVLHRCDNPPCVNPAHLYVGTHSDNMRDMWSRARRQRAWSLYCSRGHRKYGLKCRDCHTEQERFGRVRRAAKCV